MGIRHSIVPTVARRIAANKGIGHAIIALFLFCRHLSGLKARGSDLVVLLLLHGSGMAYDAFAPRSTPAYPKIVRMTNYVHVR